VRRLGDGRDAWSSASSYTQNLLVPGTRGRVGASAFNLVHCYQDTVVHAVVPPAAGPTVGEFVPPVQHCAGGAHPEG
jgi:hypothetical protein